MNISKSSLQYCLAGIHAIATEVESTVSKQTEAERTEFVQFPLNLQCILVSQMPSLLPSDALVIELGCGIGSFTSMSAAAGFRSYGIDCNPYLIEVARHTHSACVDQGYIDSDIECKFAIGNMHSGGAYEEYVRFVEATFADNSDRAFDKILPLENGTINPYEELGISLHDAGLVYCYPYPAHMPFLCKFLADNTNKKTHFILPFYNGEYDSLLPLTPRYTISHIQKTIGLPKTISIYALCTGDSEGAHS